MVKETGTWYKIYIHLIQIKKQYPNTSSIQFIFDEMQAEQHIQN